MILETDQNSYRSAVYFNQNPSSDFLQKKKLKERKKQAPTFTHNTNKVSLKESLFSGYINSPQGYNYLWEFQNAQPCPRDLHKIRYLGNRHV